MQPTQHNLTLLQQLQRFRYAPSSSSCSSSTYRLLPHTVCIRVPCCSSANCCCNAHAAAAGMANSCPRVAAGPARHAASAPTCCSIQGDPMAALEARDLHAQLAVIRCLTAVQRQLLAAVNEGRQPPDFTLACHHRDINRNWQLVGQHSSRLHHQLPQGCSSSGSTARQDTRRPQLAAVHAASVADT